MGIDIPVKAASVETFMLTVGVVIVAFIVYDKVVKPYILKT